MPDERFGDPGIVNHRHLGRLGFPRIQARHRLFTGRTADVLRRRQVAPENRAGVIVIAFHGGILAGNHPDADGMIGTGPAMPETVGGGEGDPASAPTCLRAVGIGDAGDASGRVFGPGRPFGKGFGARFGFVTDLKVREIGCQLVLVGKSAKGIFRHRAGHGDRALGQFVQRRCRGVR